MGDNPRRMQAWRIPGLQRSSPEKGWRYSRLIQRSTSLTAKGLRVLWVGWSGIWPGVAAGLILLGRPKQVHFCTGVVRKMNRKIPSVNSTKYAFFGQQFVEAGTGLKKVTFSTRLGKRGAFSHFLIRDWEASQSENHFCCKLELFTQILDCEASQYTQLECVKGPHFNNTWVLFSVYTTGSGWSRGRGFGMGRHSKTL